MSLYFFAIPALEGSRSFWAICVTVASPYINASRPTSKGSIAVAAGSACWLTAWMVLLIRSGGTPVSSCRIQFALVVAP